MQPLHLFYLLIVVSYLAGSINCAIIVCKIMGLPSPRSTGSGNPGATNVLRISKTAAIWTLIGDVLKGFIPVFIGQVLDLNLTMLSVLALAAVAGHIFPIFFKFRGGKGVATALGVFLAINIWFGGAVILLWLVMALLFRYSSLASMVACIFSPLIGNYFFCPGVVLPLFILAILVISKHSSNIKRLLSGSESKIGQKS